MTQERGLNPEYAAFVSELKTRIAAARVSAARAVNRDMILLYWDIGRGIQERQERLGWGKSVVEKLAGDLRRAFPNTTGFSVQNLWRMRQFYGEYSAPEFLAQAAPEIRRLAVAANGVSTPSPAPHLVRPGEFLSQAVRDPVPASSDTRPESILSQSVRELLAAVPWGQHVNVLTKVKDPAARLYYLRATARFGWSRNVLLNQIKAGAYERSRKEGKAHNFPLALPEHLIEQAEEALKSRYNLDFLGIGRPVRGAFPDMARK
ncbi:MAG: DUF1016 N-terminal domain-containing protein [Candidatus Sumerlaeota bacterium]|nr:DUF1016 N-terminal domain-containing protein [Candidatus Sumerlaeota bacterium]